MFGANGAELPHTTAHPTTEGLSQASTDTLEQAVVNAQTAISHARSVQLAVLAELDRRQINTTDGYRTMGEWVTQRLDEAPEAAAELIRTARTITDDIREALTSGEIGYPRAVEVTRMRMAGVDNALDEAWAHDIAGLRRRTAAQTHITPQTETDIHHSRHLHVQPTLDDTAYKLWGLLGGYEGRVVVKALEQRADEFPPDDGSRAQRRADALVSIAHDSLDPPGKTNNDPSSSRTPLVTVFINADQALESDGQTGIRIAHGPRIGPQVMEAIFCDTKIEILELQSDGTIIDHGTTSTLPPETRRSVLYRDGGRCVIAGCASTHRLEIHHLTPRSQGGTNHPHNLTTLCWYHHHIAIHHNALTIDPASPPYARQLRRPPPTGPPI